MHAPTMMFDREKAVAAELRFENKCLYANDYWQTISNIDKLKYENINRELSAYRLHFHGDGHKHPHQIVREETLCKQQALRHFGFDFSEKELEIHCRIKFLPDGKLLCNTINECDEVIAWLERLLEQNKKQKPFDEEEFGKIVKDMIKWTIKRKSFIKSKRMRAMLSKFLKL